MTISMVIEKYGLHLNDTDLAVSAETCDIGKNCNCWGRLY